MGVLYYAFPVLLLSLTRDTRWSSAAAMRAFSTGAITAAVAGVEVGRLIDIRAAAGDDGRLSSWSGGAAGNRGRTDPGVVLRRPGACRHHPIQRCFTPQPSQPYRLVRPDALLEQAMIWLVDGAQRVGGQSAAQRG